MKTIKLEIEVLEKKKVNEYYIMKVYYKDLHVIKDEFVKEEIYNRHEINKVLECDFTLSINKKNYWTLRFK